MSGPYGVPAGEYGGLWRGVCTDDRDPEKRGRIKAKLYDLFQDPDNTEPFETDWALVILHGHHETPAPGTGVFITFEAPARHTHNAVCVGTYLSMGGTTPTGISELHGQAQAETPGVAPNDRKRQSVTPDFQKLGFSAGAPAAVTIDEPQEKGTVHPHAKVRKTPGGMLIKENDTPGSRSRLEQVGIHYAEKDEKGMDATRCTVRVAFVLEANKQVIEGDDVEHVHGEKIRATEGNSSEFVNGKRFTFSRGEHAKLGSLEVKVDVDGVSGAEIFSGGGLDVQALGEVFLAAASMLLYSEKDFEVVSGTYAKLIGAKEAQVNGGLGAEVCATLGKVRLCRKIPVPVAPDELLPDINPLRYPGVVPKLPISIQPLVKATPDQLFALLAHTHLSPGGAAVFLGAPLVTPGVGPMITTDVEGA